MKFQIVADESVDFRIVTQLREIGLDVYAICEEQPSLKDHEVLSIATSKDAILITAYHPPEQLLQYNCATFLPAGRRN